jgi:acetyl-CoA carboxylase/biotin carboxylase 1
MGMPSVMGSKTHQRLSHNLDILNNILDGYDNQTIMASTLKDLLDVLHDPELPFSEATAVLSTLSGRMPSKLEDNIRTAIDLAKARNQEFPAARIRKQMEAHVIDNVKPQDRAVVRSSLASLFEVAENFKQGLKAHEWGVVASLLRRYESTEKLFGGSIEGKVLSLRETHKTNLDKVAALVLSHMKAQSKSKLVMALLDVVKNSGASFASADGELNQVLQDLAALESR